MLLVTLDEAVSSLPSDSLSSGEVFAKIRLLVHLGIGSLQSCLTGREHRASGLCLSLLEIPVDTFDEVRLVYKTPRFARDALRRAAHPAPLVPRLAHWSNYSVRGPAMARLKE